MIYKAGLAPWLDQFLFRLVQKQNRERNLSYLSAHPAMVLPPDYALYETYRLDYRKFVEDGALAAKEIVEWTRPYLNTTQLKILDWGCGTGRIARHIPLSLPDAAVYASDINEELIEWNRKNYRGISFSAINNFAPMLYAPGFFDLVYGISIFTHIEAEQQEEWMAELYRILKYNGVLIVTTQGNRYRHKLLPWQQRTWYKKGIFTQNYRQKGHRMMSTYHTPEYFRKLAQPFFTVLAHYSGASHPEKAGGQDVWILQRQMP